MLKKILIISGSPKKNGNTETLVQWFCEGAKNKNTEINIVRAAGLKHKTPGCISCRKCQSNKEYGCVIHDDVRSVLLQMVDADTIVFATPLYFFSASAQIKTIVDRMFSLYKWDNTKNTVETVLKNKTLVLLASAYEDTGLDALEQPFILTAKYTGMKFKSFLVPNSGVSGEIKNIPKIREKTVAFGKSIINRN